MTDIRIIGIKSLSGVWLDWLLKPIGQLDTDDDLASAVTIALGTDALASVDDDLPDPTDTNRRGWWGDDDAAAIWNGWPVGSKLWLAGRSKITDQNAAGGGTLFILETYIKQCIQPFIDAQIATSFVVEVWRNEKDRQQVDASITLYRANGTGVTLQYQSLWDQIKGSNS